MVVQWQLVAVQHFHRRVEKGLPTKFFIVKCVKGGIIARGCSLEGEPQHIRRPTLCILLKQGVSVDCSGRGKMTWMILLEVSFFFVRAVRLRCLPTTTENITNTSV